MKKPMNLAKNSDAITNIPLINEKETQLFWYQQSLPDLVPENVWVIDNLLYLHKVYLPEFYSQVHKDPPFHTAACN